MVSEIRTNRMASRAGLSTVTLTDTGPIFSGIATFTDTTQFDVNNLSKINTENYFRIFKCKSKIDQK